MFLDYNIFERPVANESEALELSIGLKLNQILDIVSLKYLKLKSIDVYE